MISFYGLKNSESAWKHLDQPLGLDETDQFYKFGIKKSMISDSSYVSFVKLVMQY